VWNFYRFVPAGAGLRLVVKGGKRGPHDHMRAETTLRPSCSATRPRRLDAPRQGHDALREPNTPEFVFLSTSRGTSEVDMLLMCLPFVIYSASMQMFLDSLSGPTAPRKSEARAEDDR
jgi:hypothetical protein